MRLRIVQPNVSMEARSGRKNASGKHAVNAANVMRRQSQPQHHRSARGDPRHVERLTTRFSRRRTTQSPHVRKCARRRHVRMCAANAEAMGAQFLVTAKHLEYLYWE